MRRIATIQMHFGGALPVPDVDEQDVTFWFYGSNYHRPRMRLFEPGRPDAQIDVFHPWNFTEEDVYVFRPL